MKPISESTDIRMPTTSWTITYERLVASSKASYTLNKVQFVSVIDKVEGYVGTFEQIRDYMDSVTDQYLADHYASVKAVNIRDNKDYLLYSNKGELIKFMDTQGVKADFNV